VAQQKHLFQKRTSEPSPARPQAAQDEAIHRKSAGARSPCAPGGERGRTVAGTPPKIGGVPATRNWGQPGTSSHYLDPTAFADLFRHPNRNRARIARGLHQIAHRIIRRFDGPFDVLEDAAANAVLLAILKLDRWDKSRGSPFLFFSGMMWSDIYDHLTVERRRRKRFPDFGTIGAGAIDHGGAPLTLRPEDAREFRNEIRNRKRMKCPMKSLAA